MIRKNINRLKKNNRAASAGTYPANIQSTQA